MIPLQSPIYIPANCSTHFFHGNGEGMVMAYGWNGAGYRASVINFIDGSVNVLTAMANPDIVCSSTPFGSWGLLENPGGVDSYSVLINSQLSNAIVRYEFQTGNTLATLLTDVTSSLTSFTIAPRSIGTNRWYFHWVGVQSGVSNSTDTEGLALCDAVLDYLPAQYSVTSLSFDNCVVAEALFFAVRFTSRRPACFLTVMLELVLQAQTVSDGAPPF